MAGSHTDAAAHRPADAGGPDSACGWLALAATPTFALLASLSALQPDAPAALCMGATEGGSLHGMTLMYALMSLFHLPPWIRSIAGEPRGKPRLPR